MQPRIYMYKGFVMIDPQENVLLYNKLKESTFLSRHPKGRQFYCLADNAALKFLKAFEKFFTKYFLIEDEIKTFMSQSEVQYVSKRSRRLKISTFEGITWKKHQITALEYIAKYKQFCVFLGPGTGKTLIALATIKMLGTGKFLIVTPKKAIAQYKSEAEKYLPDYTITIDPNKDADIYIVNYESVSKFEKKKYTCMILDESHRAKNVSSDINKTLCNISSEHTYLFTGTPQDKQRDEVFAQLKILNENLLAVKYLFYNRYFVLDDYYRPIAEKHSDELKEIISQCSYGDKTENLIDLPNEEEWVIVCEKNKLADIYKNFKKDKVLKGKDWLALGDSGAKHRTKLTQLCSGFIYDENNIPHRTPYNPKAQPLENLVKKLDAAIIYTVYKEEQQIIAEILKKAKRSYVCVDGSTKDAAEPLEKFKRGHVDFLVIQIVSGNAALDFPNINNIIYYSLHDSYIYYEQSKYRIRRIGQTNTCSYYYLIVKGTVEVYRLHSLKNKKSFNNKEFEIYRRRSEE